MIEELDTTVNRKCVVNGIDYNEILAPLLKKL